MASKRARHPRGGIYHPKRPPTEWSPDAADPESIWAYLQRFTRWQQERNYSPYTWAHRENTLRAFAAGRRNAAL